MKKTFKSFAFVILLIVILSLNLYSQNAVVGSGFSTGWGGVCPTTGNSNFNFLSAGVGTTYILTTTANGTGNQYWRYGIDWGGTTAQWMATGGSPDLSVSPSTTYSLNTSCTTSGALYYNVPNTSYNYVFKTLNAGSSPTGTVVFFEVQGAVQTITNVEQSPTSLNVFPGQSVLVTTTTSGTSTGQNFYLRYTDDAWATSSVLSMAGGGTSYTATIPASVNTASKVVAYYIFSSGPSNVAADGSNADLFTINLNNNGAANYTYTVASGWTTATDGNWSTAGTWTANAVPSNSLSLGTITIAHNVTQDQDGNGTIITINSSKTLTINSTFSLTAYGASTVNGTIANAGTVAVSGGSWTFSGTGKYQDNKNPATIPTATWNSGSTCEIIGYTSSTTAPTGLAQTFSNFTWNCAAQTSNVPLSGTVPTINADFNFTNSNTGALRLSASTNYTLTVGGNLTVSNGSLEMATSTATGNLNVTGNYLQNGGTFNFGNGGDAISTLRVGGDFTISSGNFRVTTGTATGKIIFNKASGNQNFSSTISMSTNGVLNIDVGTGAITNNLILNSNVTSLNGTMTVLSGSTLSMGTTTITGTTFSANSGSILKIGSTAGITSGGATGNVQTTTRNFDAGANYIYSGSANQATGNGLPTTINTLTIVNSGGGGNNTVTLTNTPTLTINGTTNSLVLTSGLLSIGSGSTINIPSGGTVSSGGGDFASGSAAGSVTFAGTGTVSGTVNFYNVNISNAVDFGASSTVNGTLTINSGGSVNTNAPTYGSSSTLKYNSTGTYGRGIEWSATSGAGYPANVQVSNNTTLDLGNGGTGTARQMSGNLVIDDGSTFSMNVNQMTASLTVLGNVTVGGGTSGVLTLSGQSGGDLVVKGDFTLGSGATLTANSRRVTFNGTSSQAISGTPTFSYITVDNSSGLTLSSSISVDNELRITDGTLDLNGSNNISLATAATLIESAGNLITNTGSPSADNGYISITKALSSPTSDNVGGLGAIITASSNMGSTIIKRFHKARTQVLGIGGAQNSVKRYYLIDPTNSGTSATIVFSYDETELNSNAEGASPIKLNLYNSTTEASGYSLQESTSIDATANTVTKSSITYATAATYWTVATNSYATATSDLWTENATWSAGSPPASGASVTINHIVTINTDPTCSSITINSGKTLQYQNTSAAKTLTVTGDITVNGTFKTGPQDADVSHQFVLGGNLIIGDAATFDLRAATSPSTRKTLTTFDGSSDVTISSPGTPSKVDFAEITIDKAASTNKVTYTISTKDPTVPGTGQTISYPRGIWEQSVGAIAFGTTTQDIPTEGSAGGGMQITGSGSVSFNASIKIRNNGVFLVNTSGTVTVGDDEGEGFLMDGSPGYDYTVTFQSGTINIAGRIGSIDGNPGNLWKGAVIISGATVNIPSVSLSNNNDCVFCIPSGGTGTFTMSLGNLNILQANQGSYAGADLDIIDATSTISGGTITIGNGGSSGSVNFDIGSTENLNLLVVNSGTLTVGTLTDLTITNASSPLTITTGDINLKEKTINLNNVNNGVAITVSGANRTFTSGTGTGYINISSDNSLDVKTISYLSSGELTIGSGAVLRIGNCQLNYVTTSSCTFASNGTFEILSGGSVTVAAPTYASGSYLKYSTGSSFNRDAEWNTPHHVIVTNTFGATEVHMGNNAPGLSLTMNGNLTIESGSTLNMDNKTASLTIMGNVLNSGGTITMSSAFGGDINLYGNFQNDGNFTCNERAVYFKGTTTQTVSGTNAITIDYMRIENGVGGSITLSREVAVDNEASFTSGIITSTGTLLTFNAGSSIAAGPSNTSFVNGPVKKIGTTDFTFPVGKNANYQPITARSITGGAGDAFTAEYSMANPQTVYGTSKDGSIDHLSQCEYWVLNQSAGTPTAIVEAAFDANSCGVTSLPDLILARWDGSQWKDHTGGCTNCYSGNTTAGTVYSNAVVPSFSPFTLASKTAQPNNPLPIDLLNFGAKLNNNDVDITWTTASETNNDYFTIEKSRDGVNFGAFAKVEGAENSNYVINYSTVDYSPFDNITYYRLKQTDIDGKYTYSNIVSVNITDNEAIQAVWFNKENRELNIEFNSISSSDFIFSIYDICGKQLINKSAFIDGKMNYTINLQSLPSGIYTVSISSNTDKFIKKVVTF